MNSTFMVRRLALIGLFSMVGLAAACAGSKVDEGNSGSANLEIINVPSDVNCIRVTAEGGTTVETFLDVTPGQTADFDLTGQPVGVVAFSADAFPSICAVVTPMTIPTWVSNTVTVNLVPGVPADIALTLYENGIAGFGVDFSAGGGCHTATQPCLADTDCCSGVCYPNKTCAGNCSPNGSACMAAAECCAGACSNNACCTPLGNACDTDSDCCAGACNGGVCGGASSPCSCGDGLCDPQCEDPMTCPVDCSPICGNGVCDVMFGENPMSCPPDCAQLCGNGVCEPGEDPMSCPPDCGGGAACIVPSDCPGQDTECQFRICNGGSCGFGFAPAGLAVSGQTAGDCALVACDGNGGVVNMNDNSDIPSDGSDCTLDLCSGGVPLFIPNAAGTACAQGGGVVCDGAGTCVECVSPANCQSGVCVGGTCAPPSCSDQVKNGAESDIDCGGMCAACDVGKQCNGPSDCQTTFCFNQVCMLLPNGAPCATGASCQSGSCADGICCDTSCGSLCQACSAAKKGQGVDGTCGFISAGLDPDNECMGPTSCNGAGSCF